MKEYVLPLVEIIIIKDDQILTASGYTPEEEGFGPQGDQSINNWPF